MDLKQGMLLRLCRFSMTEAVGPDEVPALAHCRNGFRLSPSEKS